MRILTLVKGGTHHQIDFFLTSYDLSLSIILTPNNVNIYYHIIMKKKKILHQVGFQLHHHAAFLFGLVQHLQMVLECICQRTVHFYEKNKEFIIQKIITICQL